MTVDEEFNLLFSDSKGMYWCPFCYECYMTKEKKLDCLRRHGFVLLNDL